MSFLMAANGLLYSMRDEVNRRLPKDAQIDFWGWRRREFAVLRLHREMYPESSKRWKMWVLALSGYTIMFGGFFACIVLSRRW